MGLCPCGHSGLRWLYRDCDSGTVRCGECVLSAYRAAFVAMYEKHEFDAKESEAQPVPAIDPNSYGRCKRGHLWTPKNTAVWNDGKRHCRKCLSLLYNARREKKPLPAVKFCKNGHDVEDFGWQTDKRGWRQCMGCYLGQKNKAKTKRRAA